MLYGVLYILTFFQHLIYKIQLLIVRLYTHVVTLYPDKFHRIIYYAIKCELLSLSLSPPNFQNWFWDVSEPGKESKREVPLYARSSPPSGEIPGSLHVRTRVGRVPSRSGFIPGQSAPPHKTPSCAPVIHDLLLIMNFNKSLNCNFFLFRICFFPDLCFLRAPK